MLVHRAGRLKLVLRIRARFRAHSLRDDNRLGKNAVVVGLDGILGRGSGPVHRARRTNGLWGQSRRGFLLGRL